MMRGNALPNSRAIAPFEGMNIASTPKIFYTPNYYDGDIAETCDGSPNRHLDFFPRNIRPAMYETSLHRLGESAQSRYRSPWGLWWVGGFAMRGELHIGRSRIKQDGARLRRDGLRDVEFQSDR